MIESSSPLNTQMTSITRTCIFTPSHLICMLLSPFHHLLFLYSKKSADIIGYMGHFLAYFLKRCRELKKTVTLLSNTFFSVKQKRKKSQKASRSIPSQKVIISNPGLKPHTNGLLNLCDLPILIACLDCLFIYFATMQLAL